MTASAVRSRFHSGAVLARGDPRTGTGAALLRALPGLAFH